MGQREQASAPINLAALRLIREGFAVSGMTQVELSRATGMPRSTLANILSPTAEPRLIHVAQLVAIAVAMEVDSRVWMDELESLERKRRGDELAPRRTRKAPEVQRRAARSPGRGSRGGV